MDLYALQQYISWLMRKPQLRARQAHALGLSVEQLMALNWVGWFPAAPTSAQLVLGWADNGVRLPERLRHPWDQSAVPFVACRGPRGQMQAAWMRAENLEHSSGKGTLNCLLRRRQGGQLMALTAGHVLAGDAASALGDRAIFQLDSGGKTMNGRLHDWKPSFHVGAPDTSIDAAVANISSDTAQGLLDQGFVLPQAVAAIELNRKVFLRTREAKISGTALGYLSYWLDLGDGGSAYDYQLIEGLAYEVDGGSVGGDSGAAIWNADQALLAMHAGSGPGDGRGNALAVPLGRILRWCDAEVVLRSESIFQTPSASASTVSTTNSGVELAAPIKAIQPPQVIASVDRTLDILARTMWGEARGEPDAEAGMAAVANVIANRVHRQTYWGKSTIEVCRKPYQFSCWNVGDGNRSKLLSVVAKGDKQFALALCIAADSIAGRLVDNTDGATHYYARSLSRAPRWALDKVPCARIGNHLFFKNIN